MALAALAASVVLGQRVIVGAAPSGLFSPLIVLFLALAALVILGGRGAWAHKEGVRVIERLSLPLIVLLLVFPFLGVVIGRYEVTSLYSFIVPLFPACVWMVTNSAIAAGQKALVEKACALMILAHGALGILQYLGRVGGVPGRISMGISQWDAAAQTVFNPNYVIVGRSVGLFLNANVFGIWSVFGIVFVFRFYHGAVRVVLGTVTILGVLASQSRTALFMLVFVLLVGCISGVSSKWRITRIVPNLVILTLMGGLIILLTHGQLARLVERSGLERLLSGLGVLTGGVEQDGNLSARVDAWASAWRFTIQSEMLLGTLGPPQVYFNNFIDNQFVSFFLQGSLFLCGAYVVLLFSPLVYWARRLPGAGYLSLLAVLLLIASQTITVFDTVALSTLVWVATAFLAQQNRGEVSGIDNEESPTATASDSGLANETSRLSRGIQ